MQQQELDNFIEMINAPKGIKIMPRKAKKR
jgi:hypothetical protein